MPRVPRVVRLNMIDSTRGTSQISRLCTRGLWHSWLDQLNSDMLT